MRNSQKLGRKMENDRRLSGHKRERVLDRANRNDLLKRSMQTMRDQLLLNKNFNPAALYLFGDP